TALDELGGRGAVGHLAAEILQRPQRRRGGPQARLLDGGARPEAAVLVLELLQIGDGRLLLVGRLAEGRGDGGQQDDAAVRGSFHGNLRVSEYLIVSPRCLAARLRRALHRSARRSLAAKRGARRSHTAPRTRNSATPAQRMTPSS